MSQVLPSPLAVSKSEFKYMPKGFLCISLYFGIMMHGCKFFLMSHTRDSLQ